DIQPPGEQERIGAQTLDGEDRIGERRVIREDLADRAERADVDAAWRFRERVGKEVPIEPEGAEPRADALDLLKVAVTGEIAPLGERGRERAVLFEKERARIVPRGGRKD